MEGGDPSVSLSERPNGRLSPTLPFWPRPQIAAGGESSRL